MSKILTRSVFYFDTQVVIGSRAIDFNEGGSELQATLNVGNYSATEYAAEIQRALRVVGTQLYTVTLNRTTRKLTIAAPLTFALLSNTGTRPTIAAWAVMGFSTASNKTGTNSYVGDTGTGKEYQTQYPIEKYISEDHSINLENATYNVTPIGLGQQVDFGDGRRVEMNIRLISNATGLSGNMTDFVESATGIVDFMTFIAFAMRKGKIEFMPDNATRSSFVKVILEKTAQDGDARRFALANMKTPNFYESDDITFRKVLS